jgi:putative aldouronate transport system substrate-binding protein
MIAFGVEGKHFTYIQRPSGQRGGIVQTVSDMKWAGPAQYLSGAWYIDTPQGTLPLLSVTQADVNKAGEIAAQNAGARSSVLMGFTMDIAPVLNEKNAVQAVWEKYSADMWGGIYPDWRNRLNDIIAEMNAVGLQKIIDEAQKQVDAWARTQR